jgi:hypothetical protein
MMTNLNESRVGEAIASIAVAMGKAVSPGAPLFLKELHISFVVAANTARVPTSVAVRLIQRGDFGALVEALLKTRQGDLIAFALGSFDRVARFETLPSAIKPVEKRQGVFRTIWLVLEAMGA